MYTNQITDPRSAVEWTRAYFDSLLIEMRLIDSVTPDTTARFLGREFATPIMTAALSHLDGQREDGMAEQARGALKAGAVNWAGMGSEEELERIIATGAATVKIIKPYKDRELLWKKLRHAEKAGAFAVGIDIDHAFGPAGYGDIVGEWEMSPISSDELRELTAATKLPFVVKGVLSVADAVKCRDAGVKAIVVSHHHGIMPCAVPPLMVLPDIRKAVGGDMEIVVDCGIASGADAFKCLALGADAVSVGRAIMPALKEDGAAGVARELSKITDELRGLMARTGAAAIGGIDGGVIHIAG